MKSAPVPPPRVLFTQPTQEMSNSDCSNDCDCACALDTAPLGMAAKAQLWQKNESARLLPLPERQGWHSIYNPAGPLSLVVMNSPALEIFESYRLPQPLHDKNPARQTARENLAQAGLLIPLETRASPVHQPILTAWLHLTDLCNLRCDYCYLPHRPETMPDEVALQAVETLFASAQTHRYPAVKLKYAGGEPLLRFDLIQKIHQRAAQTASRTRIRLEAVLLTNGTLLAQEHVIYLLQNQIRLMISLDGVGEWHDVQRHYAGGKPSFRQVEQAIERALVHGLVPRISLTLSKKNLPGLPASIRWLLERSLPFSLNFYRENDCASAIRSFDVSAPGTRQILEETFGLLEANPPRHSLLGALTDRTSFTASHLRPCSAGHDYLVIRPDGQIAKCQMEMRLPVTSLQSADPLLELRRAPDGLQNPPVTEKPDCRSCEWRVYCAGGCPLLTKRLTGRFDSRSPYCELYLFIFPRLLRLEALRLIRLQDGDSITQFQ